MLTNNKITRPVMRYFGGKWKLAPWIISNMPVHKVYVEPCGGAASVLMSKLPAPKLEVYNEIHSEITEVFTVLRSRPLSRKLYRLCELTPYSHRAYKEAWIESDKDDQVERVRKMLVKSIFSYAPISADRKPGARMLHTRYDSGNHRNCARDWCNHREQINGFTHRLREVMITNKPAFEVIEQFDCEEVLIYMDPPYSMHKRKSQAKYEYEWDEQNHTDLVELFLKSKSMIMLSGYACPAYDKLIDHKWIKFSFKAWTQGLSPSEEFLWINPAAQRSMPQTELELAQ